MQYCNLIKNFTFEGHQLNFSYCESEMDGPELSIYGDDASGKNFLEDDNNYNRVQAFIIGKWVNKGV
jgi:hypothetical protein